MSPERTPPSAVPGETRKGRQWLHASWKARSRFDQGASDLRGVRARLPCDAPARWQFGSYPGGRVLRLRYSPDASLHHQTVGPDAPVEGGEPERQILKSRALHPRDTLSRHASIRQCTQSGSACETATAEWAIRPGSENERITGPVAPCRLSSPDDPHADAAHTRAWPIQPAIAAQ